ncbi:GNAT family N-acetyltransferase [Jeotgalibacillus campisalis]|uniref:N-acetyltransferase domain-containing protein n=1 Tax=Jeotgalibacillus campisalis TaxID=220754 RepID=A0A0C2W518_9BACL|nr:GNAT family N-acetyltransferase [Jeotgalibacillus campisalis]KIL51108.1 hypothetical protein KR50_09890 [Jeotgalibacillus campisalis]
MDVHLKKISREQWEEKAQSYDPEKMPQGDKVETVFFGIYDEDTRTGSILYAYDEELTNLYWIHNITIDEHHQGKGYEKAALTSIITWIRENFKHCTEIRLNVSKEDDDANELYKNFGFVPTGEELNGEDVLYLSAQMASD